MRAPAIFVLASVLASGCMVGGSSSMVGRWRARRIVDSTACVQMQAPSAAGTCDKLITIGRDLPPRSFSTLTFTFPASGYMQQRGDDGYVGHGAAFTSHFEYLRGRGRYAIGARLGAALGTGFDKRMYFMVPISVVGHVGGLWGSVYLGVGYAPVALEQTSTGDEMDPLTAPVYHHNSVHVFGGTRFWLRRTLERGLSFNPELRIERFSDSTLASVTGNIGLHF